MSDTTQSPISRSGMTTGQKAFLQGGFLILPALVLFAAFVLWPLLHAFMFSFYKWNGFGPLTDFQGLDNYGDVLGHRTFPTAIRNVVLLAVTALLIQLPLALWAALALYQKAWFVSIFRTLFFLPYVLAEIAAGLIWRFVYDGEYGLLPVVGEKIGNSAILIWQYIRDGEFGTLPMIGGKIGVEMPFVLADRFWVMPAIILVIMWKYFGFHMMIYIAGLQSIPNEVVEAARMDGVSRSKIMWHIKIPMIKSSIAISVFFAIVGSLQLFDLIVPLTGGGPQNSSHTLVSFLYDFGVRRMKLGFGGATSVVLFVICVGVTLLYRKLVLSRIEE